MKKKAFLAILAIFTLLVCCTKEAVVATYDEGEHYYEGGIDFGSVITIDGVTWAPVNCGYSSQEYPYGKLFQWARKYGQGYSLSYDASEPAVNHDVWDGDLNSADSNTVYYGFTAANPCVALDRYYWAEQIHSSSWNDGSRTDPIKAGTDPCPSGWRLPDREELTALCSGNYSPLVTDNGRKGRWFTGSTPYSPSVGAKIFMPASGYGFTDSVPYSRDVTGWYWSSESDSYNRGHYMSFSDKEDPNFVVAVGKSTAGAQSISMAVRCVKE